MLSQHSTRNDLSDYLWLSGYTQAFSPMRSESWCNLRKSACGLLGDYFAAQRESPNGSFWVCNSRCYQSGQVCDSGRAEAPYLRKSFQTLTSARKRLSRVHRNKDSICNSGRGIVSAYQPSMNALVSPTFRGFDYDRRDDNRRKKLNRESGFLGISHAQRCIHTCTASNDGGSGVFGELRKSRSNDQSFFLTGQPRQLPLARSRSYQFEAAVST